MDEGTKRPKIGMYLAQMATILSNAKKGRLISRLKSAFNLPTFYVDEKYRTRYNIFHKQLLHSTYESIEARSNCQTYSFDILKHYVYKKDVEKAFRCLGALCSTKNLNEIKALFKDLWSYLLALTPNNNIIKVLSEMYKKMTHTEKPLYLYHAMLIYMHYDKLSWSENENLPFIPKAISVHNLHDAYTIDHHVCGGKNISSYIKLLKESFFVPEHKVNNRFKNEDYEKLYIYIKIAVGHFEEYREFPRGKQVEHYICKHGLNN